MVQDLLINEADWIQGVESIASPNFGRRPPHQDIKLIVVHAISLPPGEYGGNYVQQLFTNQLDAGIHEYFLQIHEMRVSAHCFIDREGVLQQFVSFLDTAWHAGVSCWESETDCNDFSIGIELEGCDEEPFETVQYEQLAKLVIRLRQQYPSISRQAICGHSDIAHGRKTDPGPHFDW